MGVILAALATIILSALARLLADEFKAFRPVIVETLLLRAVGKLPAEMQDRYAEEWRGHLDELPGDLSKVLTAFGYNIVHIKLAYSQVEFITAVALRATDISISIIAIFLLLPLLLLIALLIWLTDRKMPVFRFDVVDRTGKTHKLVKFRSMVMNHETVLNDYLAAHPQVRAEWENSPNLENDPRIFRVGYILRKTELDDLPQLWDLLRGRVKLKDLDDTIPSIIRFFCKIVLKLFNYLKRWL